MVVLYSNMAFIGSAAIKEFHWLKSDFLPPKEETKIQGVRSKIIVFKARMIKP
jgi:hypothetical protein